MKNNYKPFLAITRIILRYIHALLTLFVHLSLFYFFFFLIRDASVIITARAVIYNL